VVDENERSYEQSYDGLKTTLPERVEVRARTVSFFKVGFSEVSKATSAELEIGLRQLQSAGSA